MLLIGCLIGEYSIQFLQEEDGEQDLQVIPNGSQEVGINLKDTIQGDHITVAVIIMVEEEHLHIVHAVVVGTRSEGGHISSNN